MKLFYSIKRINDVMRAFRIQGKIKNNLELTTRQELKAFQLKRLVRLIAHARQNSPFYNDLYRGLDPQTVRLSDLPVINKSMMMQDFNRFVTDPRLNLADLQAHIGQITKDEYYLGGYRVTTTSGSSGYKGIFVNNRQEWSTALATYMRCGSFMGVGPRLPNRWKVSSIAADNPIHVSYRMAISSDIGLMKTQRLNATLSIEKQVAALNDFQPDFLSGYPSILALLAKENMAGRLNITPHVIWTFGEMRTDSMEQDIKDAWGITPFNTYGLTEAGIVLGCDCSRHSGIHLFEDLYIVENVDEQNRPVPDGKPGAKLLLTNLFNYTQPIIRYEISDMLTISPEICPCGLPFKLISKIDGRSDDIVYLSSKSGQRVPVHPVQFYTAMGLVREAKQYQVNFRSDGLHISLALQKDADQAVVTARVKESLKSSIDSLGAQCPDLFVHLVDRIERDAQRMGKLKLVSVEMDK